MTELLPRPRASRLHTDTSGPEKPAPRASVWFLLNPDDDPGITAALTGPHARARRILLVRLSPLSLTQPELARDTLRSLGPAEDGHLHDIADEDVIETALPALAAQRLCGYRIAVLAIDCPHPLSHHQLRMARYWCDHVGAQLVLIARAVTYHPALRTTLEDLLARPVPTTTASDQRRWAQPLWHLQPPLDEFPAFRAAARRAFGTHAAIADDLYLATTTATRELLTQLPPKRPRDWATERSGPTNRELSILAHVLATLTHHDPPVAARLIMLRAMQACLFTHDTTLLDWSPSTAANLQHALPDSQTPRTYDVQISAILDPLSVVVNLLCGYLEVSAATLATLTRDDLITDPAPPTPDGIPVTPPALRVADTTIALPGWMLPHLRTYLCRRDHHAPSRAVPTNALLVDEGRPVTEGDSYRLLSRVAPRTNDSYVPATGGRRSAHHFGSNLITTWMSERRLAIHDLEPLYSLVTRPATT